MLYIRFEPWHFSSLRALRSRLFEDFETGAEYAVSVEALADHRVKMTPTTTMGFNKDQRAPSDMFR